MELSEYLRIIMRRKWIIILTGLITMGIYFISSSIFPPIYSSEAILRVTPYSADDPPYTQLLYADRIMNTYIEMATSRSFKEELRDRLGLPFGRPEEVDLRIIPDSELLEISVKDLDPVLARESANAMVEMLLDASPIRDIRITVVDPADIPKSQSLLKNLLYGYIALMIGLTVGTGLAFVLDNLDPRLYSLHEIVEIAGLPLVGQIPFTRRFPKDKFLIEEFPFEDVFNRMRINVLKIANDSDIKTLMLTSAQPGEGKSAIAANLAISLAHGGARVLLVDADLHLPTIDNLFELSNDRGLKDVAQGSLLLSEAIQKSGFPNLEILLGGSDNLSPGDSIEIGLIIDVLRRLSDKYDFILVDTPAFLGVSDTFELLSSVDSVLLVAKQNEVRADELRYTSQQLHNADVQKLGLVINNDQSQMHSEYYSYHRKSKISRIKQQAEFDDEGQDAQESEVAVTTDESEKISEEEEQVEILSTNPIENLISPKPETKKRGFGFLLMLGRRSNKRLTIKPHQSKTRMPSVVILMGGYSFSDEMRLGSFVDVLNNEGYKVNIVSPMDQDLSLCESNEKIRTYRYPLPDASESFFNYLLNLILTPVLGFMFMLWVWIRHSLDVLYICNPPDSLFIAGVLPKLVGKPVLYGYRSPQPEFVAIVYSRASKILSKFLQFLERISTRLACHVIVMNDACKQILLGRARAPVEKVTVVRYWPDSDIIYPVKPDPGIRSLSKVIIAYQGNMSFTEGLDDLLDALYYLNFENKEWSCVLLGPASMQKTVEQKAANLEIAENILFTRNQSFESWIHAISAADVCVVPNPENQFNCLVTISSILDYMALKKPVVAYDLPENRVSAGDIALYAKANDRIDLADKLKDLIENPELMKTLGNEGYSLVGNNTENSRSNGALLELINSLIGNSDITVGEFLKS